jgi:hypothetical protein
MSGQSIQKTCRVLVVGGIFSLAAGGLSAGKSEWAGGGKTPKGPHGYAAGTAHVVGFTPADRQVVRDYYGSKKRKGGCPPGLAKKDNGCMPPGQAKRWQKGRPLPGEVVYHPLPGDLLSRLPLPPPRHRYVQVAGDILMIAIGTSLVVDAIEDILR